MHGIKHCNDVVMRGKMYKSQIKLKKTGKTIISASANTKLYSGKTMAKNIENVKIYMMLASQKAH